MEVTEVIKRRYDNAGPKLKETLEKKGFTAYYVETAKEAKELALSLIPKEATVSWGGSQSITEIGLRPYLIENGYNLINREDGKTKEEQNEIMRKALLCDYYLMSTNAITKDGTLVNIDGRGNRTAALSYGPKNVIMIVGMNKVVGSLDAALDRVRNVVAPVNTNRLGYTTPCNVTGFCNDCYGKECICSQVLVTRQCKPEGRIKIILIGENLGF